MSQPRSRLTQNPMGGAEGSLPPSLGADGRLRRRRA